MEPKPRTHCSCRRLIATWTNKPKLSNAGSRAWSQPQGHFPITLSWVRSTRRNGNGFIAFILRIISASESPPHARTLMTVLDIARSRPWPEILGVCYLPTKAGAKPDQRLQGQKDDDIASHSQEHLRQIAGDLQVSLSGAQVVNPAAKSNHGTNHQEQNDWCQDQESFGYTIQTHLGSDSPAMASGCHYKTSERCEPPDTRYIHELRLCRFRDE
jgi:hypothetical protein